MVGATPKPLTTPARHLALFIGLLFAGNVFFLFKAIEAMEVPVAILTYFTYPLLTGLAAAAFGVERLGLAGALAALAAFLGLALMIGAHPGGVALIGIAFALISACTRVVILLLTRSQAAGLRLPADQPVVADRRRPRCSSPPRSRPRTGSRR